ncbi:clathrin associated protein complex medium subunit [Sorochytrium milnesiophthora]
MIGAFFVFNYKGEMLISRLYRPEMKRAMSDIFRIHVVSATQVRSPITTVGSVTFYHVKHENLYIVAACRGNANVALVFEFCYKFIKLGQGYFGRLDEESVKNNFVLIYELLDEILDFGYPQNSDIDTLKMYITTEGLKSDGSAREQAAKVTVQATGATSWRRPDIKYRKNEVFLDVIEQLNLLISNKGQVLNCETVGRVVMKAYLSGTPECRMGLNERNLGDSSQFNHQSSEGGGGDMSKRPIDISDCQFHQCVRMGRFDRDRSITFVPPDGEFELMRYRVTDNIAIPFKIHPVINFTSQTRLEYKITVKSSFSSKLNATNVVIKIPTPPNTASIHGLGNFSGAAGKAKYVASENVIQWKIPRITGSMELTLSAEAELTATLVKKTWSKPPISMDFSVSMWAASGMCVRFLKVQEKSNYETIKWVRYATKAGSYLFRI